MSCLDKSCRINNSKEFSKIYKSDKKWHNKSFITFFKPNQNNLKLACVASKKIGNAIKRNKAKRRLRAIFLEYETALRDGSYIVVAKNEINNKDYKTLKKDFIWTMQKMKLFLNN